MTAIPKSWLQMLKINIKAEEDKKAIVGVAVWMVKNRVGDVHIGYRMVIEWIYPHLMYEYFIIRVSSGSNAWYLY